MIPVILSGGQGTRLWPLSRASFPKQFCELLDESLLQKTLNRVRPLGTPWTITVRELRDLTLRLYREQGLSVENVVFEPMGRNTAPAIALLCRALELRGLAGEVAGVFPADHLVQDERAFRRAIACASRAAEEGFVATLGIRPDSPATGFGYIETRPSAAKIELEGLTAFEVQGFREKPDLETARQFLAQGNFFWNAGIFVFRVERMIAHFKRLMPQLWSLMEELRADFSNLDEVYARAPKISVDFGIMEKLAKEQVCVPCEIGWSDLGSWDDVARFAPGAGAGTNKAVVVESNAKNCFVYSADEKACALVGVEDLIVVDTEDALLVARKGVTQDVRIVVDRLTELKHRAAREHRFEVRPWGRFTILRDETHFKSKIIVIDPGAQISYQSHAKRAEHWVVVRGHGEVVLNDKVIAISAGESVFIPVGAKHRMRNTGSEHLEFVEVQVGEYFGEDDITRYQDDYKRA